MGVEITPLGPFAKTVVIPGSKSYTARALVIGALATGRSTIRNALDCDDARHMVSALARLGVGTLYWSVGGGRAGKAHDLASRLANEDLPRIEIVVDLSPLPGRILTGPPPEPGSKSLAAILEALGAPGGSAAERLQTLWLQAPGIEPISPRVRQGGAASFLIVSPAPEGRLDLTETGLREVWLEGHKIEETP